VAAPWPLKAGGALRTGLTNLIDSTCSGRYMQLDRREHCPWLLRFALTPADEQHLLLVEPPPRS
jgi:hypothetical protein